MGSGIAQVAASAGHRTILFWFQFSDAGKIICRIAENTFRLKDKSKITEEEAIQIQQRISYAASLSEMLPCDLIIER